MKRLVLIAAILIATPALTGAASDTMEQVFQIDFTAYENDTFADITITAENKTAPLPYSSGPYTKPYEFAFHDTDGTQLSSQTVHIQFPSAPLLPPGESNMASLSIRLPAAKDASELRISQDGERVTTVDLVDRVCSPEPDDVCNEYCGHHGADPDCQDDTTLLIIIAAIALVAAIGGSILFLKKR